jgi:hypothetical protein
LLVLFAAIGAAGIYGIVVWNRWGADPTMEFVLGRLPSNNAVTLHVDLAAIRKSGKQGWPT